MCAAGPPTGNFWGIHLLIRIRIFWMPVKNFPKMSLYSRKAHITICFHCFLFLSLLIMKRVRCISRIRSFSSFWNWSENMAHRGHMNSLRRIWKMKAISDRTAECFSVRTCWPLHWNRLKIFSRMPERKKGLEERVFSAVSPAVSAVL